AAVLILLGELQPIGGIVGRPRAPLVFAVLGDEQPTLQWMIVGCETDTVRVPVSPRERLDRGLPILGVELCSQVGPVTDARSCRRFEGGDDLSGALDAMRRVPAGRNQCAKGRNDRREYIVAEHDVLTGDVLLAEPAPVVIADHTRVGRRSLRPVDMITLKGDLLVWVVSGGETRDEGGHEPAVRIHRDDGRAVVRTSPSVGGLVGVGRKEPPTLKAVLEGDVDGRAMRLEASPARRGLGKRAGYLH